MRTINKNLKITNSNYFMGIELHPYEKEYVIDYLQKFIVVMNHAVHQRGRLYMVRIDLRFPEYFCTETMDKSNWAISRLFDALRDKLDARDARMARQGDRVHPHNLHFVWVREQVESEHWHYHAILMLNGHAYRETGPYDGSCTDCLAFLIQDAWSTALRIHLHDAMPMVDFPRGRYCFLDTVHSDRKKAIKLGSYLFKVRSKQHGHGYRLFGTSEIG